MPAPRRLASLAAATALTVATFALLLAAIGPLTGRWQVASVLSGSMEPTIRTGSVAIMTGVPSGAVAAGDVIAFEAPTAERTPTVHRVTEIVEGGSNPVIRTKGDANEGLDPWRARLVDDRAWKVRWTVPYLGYLAGFLQGPAVRLLLLTAVAGAVLYLGLRWIWQPRPAGGPPGARGAVPGAVVGAVALLAVSGAAAQPLFAVWASSDRATHRVSTGTASPAGGLQATPVCELLAPAVELTWTAATSPATTGYTVYRATQSGGPYDAIARVTGAGTTGYTDADLGLALIRPAPDFFYVVRANVGAWESADSNEASASGASVTSLICL